MIREHASPPQPGHLEYMSLLIEWEADVDLQNKSAPREIQLRALRRVRGACSGSALRSSGPSIPPHESHHGPPVATR